MARSLSPRGRADSLSKYMADERMPHVVVAAGVPVTGDAVFCDDAVGAEKAMTHLRALGHVRICHVVGDRPHPGVARRGDAYRKNVVAAGHEPIMGPAPGESMRAFVTHCVARRKATAFLLCDDSYAVDFYMACHSMGLGDPRRHQRRGIQRRSLLRQALPASHHRQSSDLGDGHQGCRPAFQKTEGRLPARGVMPLPRGVGRQGVMPKPVTLIDFPSCSTFCRQR